MLRPGATTTDRNKTTTLSRSTTRHATQKTKRHKTPPPTPPRAEPSTQRRQANKKQKRNKSQAQETTTTSHQTSPFHFTSHAPACVHAHEHTLTHGTLTQDSRTQHVVVCLRQPQPWTPPRRRPRHQRNDQVLKVSNPNPVNRSVEIHLSGRERE